MLRLKRSTQQEGPIHHAGRTVTLVTETWTLSIRLLWVGVGATYRRPHTVTADGVITWRITDHVMVARVLGVLALVIALLVRRIQ